MRQLTVVGNIGRNAELRENKHTGEKFYTMPVAEDTGYKDKETGERVNRVEWFECTLNYERFKNVHEYLKKGSRITLFGYPTIKSYRNKEGKQVLNFKISVKQIDFYNAKQKFEQINKTEVADTKTGEIYIKSEKKQEKIDSSDDDLPF